MDRIFAGTTVLKIVVFVQIVFSTWGYLTPPGAAFMPITYGYYHNILLLFGALSIIKPNSSDVVLMYLAVNLFSILNDIIILSLFEPPAHDYIERNDKPASTINTYRFALGMSIVNLLLKPVICFILYKIYIGRGGSVRSELVSITGAGNGRTYNGYDTMDEGHNVETASPHHNIDHAPTHSG